MKRLKQFWSRLLGPRLASPPLVCGSVGAGLMLYTFIDAEGNQHVQPRDWVFYRDAAGTLTRQLRPTIVGPDAQGMIYPQPVWIPDALRLEPLDYLQDWPATPSG